MKAYIAGKLNGMTIDYIKNMHKMMVVAEKVRKLGVAVYIPCIDILMGLFAGNYEYEDYFDNSQPFLKDCDFVFLVPGWEDSEGTRREIETARACNIPIFDCLQTLEAWLPKDEIC